MRDRVVIGVLGVGGVVALLAWHGVGPWPALALVLVALFVASVVYRIEPPRIDLDRPLPPLEVDAGEVTAGRRRIDQ